MDEMPGLIKRGKHVPKRATWSSELPGWRA